MSSSETERDSSESDEDDDSYDMRIMDLVKQHQMNLFLTAWFVNNRLSYTKMQLKTNGAR